MKLLIINIKELILTDIRNTNKIAGKEMDKLKTIENAFLYIEDGIIIDYNIKNINIHGFQDISTGIFWLPQI